MNVRIYKPAKSAMQSGRAGSEHWVLEFEPQSPRQLEPLMGWTSSNDTQTQSRLFFDSAEQAVEYAQQRGYAYHVEQAQERIIKPKSYLDNFAADRVLRWTH